ncbi:hypothetical protein J4Q44_G00150760 [Coregonus suidteri]|uniref:Uncharacterized protein n=1 Tax=Coregonus suidteri TaxID=861788 RepID=A0AAN8LSD3_9TELE
MCCSTRAGALRRPDLVFVKNGTALVVGVTVRYEMASNTLEVAAAEKVARYTPIARYIMAALKHHVNKAKLHGPPENGHNSMDINQQRGIQTRRHTKGLYIMDKTSPSLHL